VYSVGHFAVWGAAETLKEGMVAVGDWFEARLKRAGQAVAVLAECD
jgi:hypothetical protein